MAITSHSELKKNLSTNETVAFIYSINDLDRYLVEIYKEGRHYFLTKGDDPTQYLCLENAKIAAKDADASQAYLLLNRVYQDIGISNIANMDDKYDCMPLSI